MFLWGNMIKRYKKTLLTLSAGLMLWPTALFALTSGPAMPEYSTFVPVDLKDMVNLNTGGFAYSIPVMTVPGPGLSYPIALGYNSGIYQKQEASWVGLGWNLQAGAINRNVNDIPDDFSGDIIEEYIKSDNIYGWAKLMAEMTLRAYHKEYGLKAASCRYFTVYVPRGVENHALIAMIARAFIKQDPYEVWGDGNQIRNWTYIDDIVNGTILAAEKIDDGTAVNLGTMERNRVIDAVNMILEYTGHKPQIQFRLDMPVGPVNRVADNSLAKKLLGWEPKILLKEGLKKTIEWYYSSRNKAEVEENLSLMLTGR